MQFKNIIGQQSVKNKLIKAFREKRVPHTQLFIGQEGSGTLALAVAYAQFLNCNHKQDGDSCGICSSCIKYQKLAHPDLHFIFPTAKNEKIKKDPQANLFMSDWQSYFLSVDGYVSQSGWYQYLNLGGNKQGSIYIRDANDIVKSLSFKPYESDYKVIIIYLAEKLNITAANKLLKSLEEPPENSLIFLVAEKYEQILPTIRSRTQIVKVPLINSVDLKGALRNKFPGNFNEENLDNIVNLANGNWNRALEALGSVEVREFNFLKFREWMRICYKPDDYLSFSKLIQELSRMGREKQKSFLNYGLYVVHNTLLINEKLDSKVVADKTEINYFKNFSPFINDVNRVKFYRILNESIYHLERNVNPTVLFTHLSFQIVNFLKEGKTQVVSKK